MFFQSFGTTFQAIFGLVFLGSIGFFLVKRGTISGECLKLLSDLVIGLFIPFLMFYEIVKKFSFDLYPNWWLFPLLSLLVASAGYGLGLLALSFDKTLRQDKGDFLGVVTFQNSGYLPLPLVAALLPPGIRDTMFIYIFLFLLGFNMTVFSFGLFLLTPKDTGKKFDLKHMFNGPVIATLSALLCVFLRINRFLPDFFLNPVGTFGGAAIPLSILVVGGNLGLIRTGHASNFRKISYAIIIKLLILPAIFLGFIILLKPDPLVGLLVLLQAAMPTATLMSIISRKLDQDGCFINQVIFYSHLASIVTISMFLAIWRFYTGGIF